jgi:hypothetical protein
MVRFRTVKMSMVNYSHFEMMLFDGKFGPNETAFKFISIVIRSFPTLAASYELTSNISWEQKKVTEVATCSLDRSPYDEG